MKSIQESRYPKDFIRDILISQLEPIVKSNPYYAFLLMAIGIEFLGKCTYPNLHDWYKGKPMLVFEHAFKLNGLNKYAQYLNTHHIWQNFRNGYAHTFKPQNKITLSSGYESPNLTIINGKLVIRCEDLFNDFKTACQQVIDMDFSKDNKMNRVFMETETILLH